MEHHPLPFAAALAVGIFLFTFALGLICYYAVAERSNRFSLWRSVAFSACLAGAAFAFAVMGELGQGWL